MAATAACTCSTAMAGALGLEFQLLPQREGFDNSVSCDLTTSALLAAAVAVTCRPASNMHIRESPLRCTESTLPMLTTARPFKLLPLLVRLALCLLMTLPLWGHELHNHGRVHALPLVVVQARNGRSRVGIAAHDHQAAAFAAWRPLQHTCCAARPAQAVRLMGLKGCWRTGWQAV